MGNLAISADGDAQRGLAGLLAQIRVVVGQHRDRGLEHVHGMGRGGHGLQRGEDTIRHGTLGGEELAENGQLGGRGQPLVEEQVHDLFVARPGEVLDFIPAVDEAPVFTVHFADAGAGNRDAPQPRVQRDFAFLFHVVSWPPPQVECRSQLPEFGRSRSDMICNFSEFKMRRRPRKSSGLRTPFFRGDAVRARSREESGPRSIPWTRIGCSSSCRTRRCRARCKRTGR